MTATPARIAAGFAWALAASLLVRFTWVDPPDAWVTRLVVVVAIVGPVAMIARALAGGRPDVAINACLAAMAPALYASLGIMGSEDRAWYAWILALTTGLFSAALVVARRAPPRGR